MSQVTPLFKTKNSLTSGKDADFENSSETIMSPQKIATPPSADSIDGFTGNHKDSKTFSISSLVDVDKLTASLAKPTMQANHLSPSAAKSFISPQNSPLQSAVAEKEEWSGDNSVENSPNSEEHTQPRWTDASLHAAAARFNALRLSGAASGHTVESGAKARHSFFAGGSHRSSNASLESFSGRSRNNSFTYAPVTEGASTAPFASIVPSSIRLDYGGAAWNGNSSFGLGSQPAEARQNSDTWAPVARKDSFPTQSSHLSQMNGERKVENEGRIPENLVVHKQSHAASGMNYSKSGNSSIEGSPSLLSNSSSNESFGTFMNSRVMPSSSTTGFRSMNRRSTLQPGNVNPNLPAVMASLDSSTRRHSIDFEAVSQKNGIVNNAKDNGKSEAINKAANGSKIQSSSSTFVEMLNNSSEPVINSFRSSSYEPSTTFRHSLASGQVQNALLKQKQNEEAAAESQMRQQNRTQRFSHADVSSIASLPRTDSGTQPERDHPLKDVGKGVPLSSLPPMSKLWVVEFKAGRSDVYYSVGTANNTLANNDFVIVEGDRGKDLGKIMSEITPQELLELQARQHPALDFVHMTNREIHPRIVYRRAHADEIKHLMIKNEDEERSLKFIRARVAAHNLDMHVIDSEYQFDRRKLTFFFISTERIDFRNLIQELFKIYKTRIWLCSVNGRNRPSIDFSNDDSSKGDN